MLSIICLIALTGQLAGSPPGGVVKETAGPRAEILETRLPAYTAEIVKVDSQAMTVKLGNETRSIAFDQLLRSRFTTGGGKLATGKILVQLRDGSEIRCRQIRSDGKNVQLDLADALQVSVPTRQVSSCLLQPLETPLQKQWETLSQSRIAGDALILQRSPEALDKIEGLINEVTDTIVKFELDGQKIDVQRTKLAGWRFFAPPSDERTKLLAVVRDASGSNWMVQSISGSWSAGSSAILHLVGGNKVSLPTSSISDIDFSFGSMRFLADLEPLERKVEPRLTLAVKLPEADVLFGPRSTADDSARGATSGPGIQFMGSGTVVYRVPTDFRRLLGSVALTPDGPQFVPCKAQVFIEDKVVWEKTLDQPHEVFPIEIEVDSNKRIRFTVQSESKQPVGDLVTWRQLRFVK